MNVTRNKQMVLGSQKPLTVRELPLLSTDPSRKFTTAHSGLVKSDHVTVLPAGRAERKMMRTEIAKKSSLVGDSSSLPATDLLFTVTTIVQERPQQLGHKQTLAIQVL